jgi:hypothetical protein
VGPDTLHIQVIDPGNPPSSATTVTATADLSISVVVNDVPVITVPPPESISRNHQLSLAGQIAIGDSDIGAGTLQLTLQVQHGTLSAGAGKNTIQGPTLQFNGTLAELKSFLSTLAYTPDLNYTGPDTLNIQVVDAGNPANPSTTVTATQALPINVVPNDVPVITVPDQQKIGVDAQLAFSGGKGAAPLISIDDGDIGSGKSAGLLDITLQVDHGTLAINGLGLRFLQRRPGLLEFTGTLAQINLALATLVYQPDLGYVGIDALQVEVYDPGNPPDPLTAVTAFQTVGITIG